MVKQVKKGGEELWSRLGSPIVGARAGPSSLATWNLIPCRQHVGGKNIPVPSACSCSSSHAHLLLFKFLGWLPKAHLSDSEQNSVISWPSSPQWMWLCSLSYPGFSLLCVSASQKALMLLTILICQEDMYYSFNDADDWWDSVLGFIHLVDSVLVPGSDSHSALDSKTDAWIRQMFMCTLIYSQVDHQCRRGGHRGHSALVIK